MRYKDLALALLVVTIWGANFTVIKLGLDGVPPMLLAALRYLLAALPAVFFIRRPAVELRYWVAYGTTVGIGQFGCLFYAMHIGMPAGLASVVLQSQALFTLLFAAALLQEAISRAQLTGLTTAAVGHYLIGQTGDTTSLPATALGFTLAGAAFWGLSNIVVRKAASAAAARGERLDMLSLVVWSSLIPPLPLLLLALFLDTPETVVTALLRLDGTSLFSIVYLAFLATLLGFGAWSRLLAHYPAGQIAPLSLLVPVTGLLTANLVLDEQLSALQWGGCLLVFSGLLLSVFGFPRLPGRESTEIVKN
ncbi:MAG: EamA family transporter [Zoogloea oleivorans]|jgi:O-acetylserine/cysteine efflux transporter|uniref:EamA family transporter n=1 Tax=Zoogloea oleivorans TaxID=1552750 RepID=UPI002A361ADD|nr:EamA family transporter [Zoogloea oleivorans]MDY0036604.1 EamA family transporter [Zoogloea oleivorans]